MKCVYAFAALTLVVTVGRAVAAQESSRPYVQFRAYCTFEREGSYLNTSDYEQADVVLSLHAQAHGWRNQKPDLVSPNQSARCPEAMLDQMAEARDLARLRMGVFLYRSFAHVLERNGRVGDALALLDRALEEARLGP